MNDKKLTKLMFIVVMSLVSILAIFIVPVKHSNKIEYSSEMQNIKYVQRPTKYDVISPSNNNVVPILQQSRYYYVTPDYSFITLSFLVDEQSYASNYESATGVITGALSVALSMDDNAYTPLLASLGRAYVKLPSESGLFGSMGKSLHMSLMYYLGTSGEQYRMPVATVDYVYNDNTEHKYVVVSRLLAQKISKDGSHPGDINVWFNFDQQGYTLSISDPSSVYIRSWITPYTELNPVGAYNNAINRIYVATTFTDDNGLHSAIWSSDLSGNAAKLSGLSYDNVILIPLMYFHTQNRNILYLITASIGSSSPSSLSIDSNLFDANTGDYMQTTHLASVTLPNDMYNPDLFVYYITNHVHIATDGQGNFVTGSPIRIALYSPTAQKIIYVDISLKFEPVDESTYNVEVTSASVSQTLDLTQITGGDTNKARLLICDLTSPKAKAYGIYCFRTTELDNRDPFYNSPFSIVFYRWTGSSWEELDEVDVFPRAKKNGNTYYLSPKAKVLYRANFVDGVASLIELSDVQYLSDDGSTCEGIAVSDAKIMPHKEYDIRPTKFTLSISYDYYITPISVTYTKADPSEPDTLNNVLIPIEITDMSIIATQDARDVRFFTTNDYGGDYWQNNGLTYAVKEIDSNHAVFYVLVPQITADNPITIYMYSGFKYAKPVATEYYSLINQYPILTTQS